MQLGSEENKLSLDITILNDYDDELIITHELVITPMRLIWITFWSTLQHGRPVIGAACAVYYSV